MSEIPDLGARQELLRKLGMASPDRQPTIEHAAGVIIIGDHNTINVVDPERHEQRPRRRAAKVR